MKDFSTSFYLLFLSIRILQIERLFCLSYVPTPRFLIPCTLYEFSSYFGFPNINRYLVIFYKLDHIFVTQIYYFFVFLLPKINTYYHGPEKKQNILKVMYGFYILFSCKNIKACEFLRIRICT